jgi:hypothetical protein
MIFPFANTSWHTDLLYLSRAVRPVLGSDVLIRKYAVIHKAGKHG